MRLALSPTLCPDYTADRFVELAGAAGYRRVELCRDGTQSTPVHNDFSMPMVRDILRHRGVDLAAFRIRRLTGRKADSDERNLAYNLRQLEWDIHLGRALGADRIVLCAGERTGDALDDLADGLGQLAERLPEVSLNLSNLAHSRVQGLEDFDAALPRVSDSVHVCLDTGELLTAGEDVTRVASSLGPRLGVVRLSDRAANGPVPLGCGDLPLGDLLRQLQRRGYQGDLVVGLADVAESGRPQAAVEARQRVEGLLRALSTGEGGP